MNQFDSNPLLFLLAIPFLALLLWALIDVLRRPQERMRYLPKWAWIVIVLLGNTLGQAIYLIVGRDNSAPVQETSGPSVSQTEDAADALYGKRRP